MDDFLLVVLGAVLGAGFTIGGKVLLDPGSRASLEGDGTHRDVAREGVEHADEIQAHIQELRNAVSSALGFDADAIAATIALSLTSRWGPEPLKTAATHTDSEELAKYAQSASDAWIAVGVARTDAKHGVMSEEELHQPLYAVQWYETQVGYFEDEARKLLRGRA